MQETLYCKIGRHEWLREATRGRKPIACPEHRGGDPAAILASQAKTAPPPPPPPQPEPVVPASPKEQPTPEVEPEPRPLVKTKIKIVPLDALKREHQIDPESERILSYIESEVNSPRWPGARSDEDVKALQKAYRLRLRQVTRGSET